MLAGPGAVITNDRMPRAGGDWTITATRVARGASIGANATVIAGVDVGEWAMVAAGAVVTRAVGAHELAMGNPARRVAWICRCARVRLRPGEATVLRWERCGTHVEPLD